MNTPTIDRNEIDPVIARWETRGNDWLELYHSRTCGDYYYRGNQCGGGVQADTAEVAIEKMEAGQVRVLRADRPSVRRVK